MSLLNLIRNWLLNGKNEEKKTDSENGNDHDGSTFKVPLTKIVSITPHPNADRLELATVYGFRVVVRKDQYKIGDYIIYIPVDSILPPELELQIFPKDSKITLNNSRVRQIKIRSFPSQGMLLSLDDYRKYTRNYEGLLPLEADLAKNLGITKYEPPVIMRNLSSKTGMFRDKTYNHSLFHSYNGIDNIKWYPSMFVEGEEVTIQEKLHGTNARFSKLPREPKNLYQRILKRLGLLRGYEFNYGSNNVQISRKIGYKGFYDDDVYGQVAQEYDVEGKIKDGEIVYGEIIGQGIQKNYDYGCCEPTLVIFDVKLYNSETKTFTWMDPDLVRLFCLERGFEFVPVLYEGPYNREIAHKLTFGPSIYHPETKVREGIVVKSRYAYNNANLHAGRKSLKWLSEDYLSDPTNTDCQ